MLNLTALTTSDSGSKKTARFSLQVQFKNIYSGPVMCSASRFSPGFLWQVLPLILGSALQQAGLEDISPTWMTQCLEGLTPCPQWIQTLPHPPSSCVTLGKFLNLSVS